MRLESVLETVLYHASGEEDELARFYAEVLGLPRIGGGLTFRVGDGVLLLFNRERSSVQSTPPPHGASGPVHTCFVADDYEGWKRRLAPTTSRSSKSGRGTTASSRSTSTTRPGTCWRSPTAIYGRACRTPAMLSIRIGEEVYGLDDESATELVRRVSEVDPVLQDERDVVPDRGQLAEIGTVIEAWALETDGDLPGDVEEIRLAIAEELG